MAKVLLIDDEVTMVQMVTELLRREPHVISAGLGLLADAAERQAARVTRVDWAPPMAGVDSDLDLVVRYQTPDISNTNRIYQDNVSLIKALVGRHPEFRDGFAAIIARAVDPSGKDFGTLLRMKDIK